MGTPRVHRATARVHKFLKFFTPKDNDPPMPAKDYCKALRGFFEEAQQTMLKASAENTKAKSKDPSITYTKAYTYTLGQTLLKYQQILDLNHIPLDPEDGQPLFNDELAVKFRRYAAVRWRAVEVDYDDAATSSDIYQIVVSMSKLTIYR